MPVYMIRCGFFGPVKIGTANDPVRRAMELQVGQWQPLSIIRLLKGDAAEERMLHSLFRHEHIRGEWFRYSLRMKRDVGLEDLPLPVPSTPPVLPEPPAHLIHHRELLKEIVAFTTARGIAESTFGFRAVNDGKFVKRVRAGLSITCNTVDRARDFIRDQAPVSVQSQTGEVL